MGTVLQQEEETYRTLKNKLVKTALGKFVLIYKDQLVGTFDTRSDAISQGYRQFGNVPFLTRKVEVVEEPIVMPFSLENVILEISSQIPEEEQKKVPPDFLDQLEHYIYGTPKK